jgi:gluconate 5-dehydrogenase
MTDELDRFRLDGKVALVAGGSGGIGRRLCEAFAAVGAHVAIVGRSEQGLQAAREAVEQVGGEALVLPGDMTVEAEADRVVEETVTGFGRLDVLVNGIGGGIARVMNPAEQFREEDWDWQLELNLKTQFLVSKAAARAMIAGGRGGRILNISSVRGHLGIRLGYSPYVAAKAAMDGLTRQHATEWAQYGITVNAIAPTFVATEQTAPLLDNRDFYDSLVQRIPLGRIASTDDIVGPALFFCSDASAFVTGQILLCDGGLTATQ